MRRPIACLLTALLLSACTGDGDPGAAPTPTAKVPIATVKPKVEPPQGPPPKTLVQNDLTVGTGPLVIPGQVVTVQYVGIDYATGKQFDASWDRGNPFSFQLGNGDVIQGWDKGLLGMRVGGRRRLVIPPALAYGEQQGGHELAGKTLVFVVDVIATGGTPAGAEAE